MARPLPAAPKTIHTACDGSHRVAKWERRLPQTPRNAPDSIQERRKRPFDPLHVKSFNTPCHRRVGTCLREWGKGAAAG
jgi:hypothetical protein